MLIDVPVVGLQTHHSQELAKTLTSKHLGQ